MRSAETAPLEIDMAFALPNPNCKFIISDCVIVTQTLTAHLSLGSNVTASDILASTAYPELTYDYVYSAPIRTEPGHIVTGSNQVVPDTLKAGTFGGQVDLKLVSVAVSAGELSPADQANGYTFRGSVALQIVARTRSASTSSYGGFSDYSYSADVSLQNGQVTVSNPDASPNTAIIFDQHYFGGLDIPVSGIVKDVETDFRSAGSIDGP
jgi:hypothetical protein